MVETLSRFCDCVQFNTVKTEHEMDFTSWLYYDWHFVFFLVLKKRLVSPILEL